MRIVVDASVVVAALVDAGPLGAWADGLIGREALAAPHILPAEVASVLRRASLAGDISAESAGLAFADFLELRVELFAFAPVAARVWELRSNVTSYDAWYVAIAEALEVPLATIDRRLTTAPGASCTFLAPPDIE